MPSCPFSKTFASLQWFCLALPNLTSPRALRAAEHGRLDGRALLCCSLKPGPFKNVMVPFSFGGVSRIYKPPQTSSLNFENFFGGSFGLQQHLGSLDRYQLGVAALKKLSESADLGHLYKLSQDGKRDQFYIYGKFFSHSYGKWSVFASPCPSKLRYRLEAAFQPRLMPHKLCHLFLYGGIQNLSAPNDPDACTPRLFGKARLKFFEMVSVQLLIFLAPQPKMYWTFCFDVRDELAPLAALLDSLVETYEYATPLETTKPPQARMAQAIKAEVAEAAPQIQPSEPLPQQHCSTPQSIVQTPEKVQDQKVQDQEEAKLPSIARQGQTEPASPPPAASSPPSPQTFHSATSSKPLEVGSNKPASPEAYQARPEESVGSNGVSLSVPTPSVTPKINDGQKEASSPAPALPNDGGGTRGLQGEAFCFGGTPLTPPNRSSHAGTEGSSTLLDLQGQTQSAPLELFQRETSPPLTSEPSFAAGISPFSSQESQVFEVVEHQHESADSSQGSWIPINLP